MFDKFFGKGDAPSDSEHDVDRAATRTGRRPIPPAIRPRSGGSSRSSTRCRRSRRACIASAAYILARAANADLDISDDETAAMEDALQRTGGLDEATAVLVVEMAKLQAKTVGGTEDYVVTREFRSISTPDQRLDLARACFVIGAVNGSISAGGECGRQ